MPPSQTVQKLLFLILKKGGGMMYDKVSAFEPITT